MSVKIFYDLVMSDRKIDAWTGNAARGGNFRALLACLDKLLYIGATVNRSHFKCSGRTQKLKLITTKLSFNLNFT